MKIGKTELSELRSIIAETVRVGADTLTEKQELQLLINLLEHNIAYTKLDKIVLDIKITLGDYFNHEYIEVKIRSDKNTFYNLYAIYTNENESHATHSSLEDFKSNVDNALKEANEIKALWDELQEYVK